MRPKATATPRAAGHHARATANSYAIGYSLIAFACAAIQLGALVLGVRGIPLALIAIASIGICVAIDRYRMPLIDRWSQGASGEEKVGAVIKGMEASGWRALHDVCISDRGNIDHILVGPAGIFTVETKSRKGKIEADHIDDRWLAQAFAQSKFIEDIALQPVEPLLVFSDAYVIGRAVNRRKGVMTLPARMLAGHLGRRPRKLSDERVDQIYLALVAAVS